MRLRWGDRPSAVTVDRQRPDQGGLLSGRYLSVVVAFAVIVIVAELSIDARGQVRPRQHRT